MKWLKNIFKKKMYNDQIIERLMSYKSMYQGGKFQWVKNYPQGLAGAVSSIIDIELQGNRIVALFENNQRVTIDQLNSDFFMITDSTPAMSPAEIMSLNVDPGVTEEVEAMIKKPETKLPHADEFLTFDHSPTPRPRNMYNPIPTQEVEPVNPTSIFGMFSLNPTKLKLDVEVKLPAMNLLKAMFAESADKEDFLQQVAKYVQQSITQESVRDAVLTKLGPVKSNK